LQVVFLLVCFVQVLQCIPDNWSLGLIRQFLTSSVRKTLNRSRTTHVERMLLRGDNLAMRLQTFLLTKDPFYMTEDRQVVSLRLLNLWLVSFYFFCRRKVSGMKMICHETMRLYWHLYSIWIRFLDIVHCVQLYDTIKAQ